MQINNNLFARQTPLMMGNKIGGTKPNNVVAKAINNARAFHKNEKKWILLKK